jgi:hypothetical protein
VAAHQAIGVEPPVSLIDLPTQQREKSFPIMIVEKDVLTPITPRRHVVRSPRKFQPHGLAMAGKLSGRHSNVKN